MVSPDLSWTIRGQRMPNPVGVASGTFGYAKEYEPLLNVNRLGAVFTKAVTWQPRLGNPGQRLAEVPGGLLNSIGLANVGVQAFIEKKWPYLSTLSPAIFVNVAGSTDEEYAQVIQALETVPGIGGYEINISCPNVSHGGLALGTDPDLAAGLTRRLRPLTARPLILKLSPNVTDIAQIGLAVQEAGADAVSAINTLKGMAVDTRRKKPVLPRITAGFSGPALLAVGLAAVWSLRQVLSIPIWGLGGITEPDHALQYLLAGAQAVQVGSGTFVQPRLAERCVEAIEEFARKEGLSRLEDFHQWNQSW